MVNRFDVLVAKQHLDAVRGKGGPAETAAQANYDNAARAFQNDPANQLQSNGVTTPPAAVTPAPIDVIKGMGKLNKALGGK